MGKAVVLFQQHSEEQAAYSAAAAWIKVEALQPSVKQVPLLKKPPPAKKPHTKLKHI